MRGQARFTTENDSGDSQLRSQVPTRTLEIVADFAQLAVVTLVIELLLFEGTDVVGLVRVGVIAAILAAVLKSQGWFVLLVLQASLFMREPRRPEMILGLVPVVYCVASLFVVAYAYLGKTFRKCISQWTVEQLLFALGMDEPNNSQSTPRLGSRFSWFRFLSTQFVIWLMVVVVAMLALRRLPITTATRSDWLRRSIENEYTFWPGATLLVLSLLIVVVFMETSWRQMTKAQASLYLRSSFVLAHYGDLRMIVLRRIRSDRLATAANSARKQLAERVIGPP